MPLERCSAVVFMALIATAPLAMATDPCSPCSNTNGQGQPAIRLSPGAQFQEAREHAQWSTADALALQLLANKTNEREVTEYYVYDRGRCGEALKLLAETRKNPQSVKYVGPKELLASALVCEAARIEPTDPSVAMSLLGEAIDLGSYDYRHLPELYYEFARQGTLNLPAMRFLIAHELDNDDTGYAMEAQISNGRADNVRTLLELGANPNERHGVQHSALGKVVEVLPKQGEVALEIARILIEYGADPTMVIDFSDVPPVVEVPPTPKSPLEPKLNDIFREAARKFADANPVDIDFYDYESLGPGSGSFSFARFYVYNRSDKTLVLDMYRNPEGFDYSGNKTVIEYQLPPGKTWHRYEWTADELPIPKDWKRVELPGNEMSLVRVPVNLYDLLDGPPSLRVRLRMPSVDGIDYVSEPFSLHDSRYVRGYWPRKGKAQEALYQPGEKLVLEKGRANFSKVDHRGALHDRPSVPDEGTSSERKH